MKSQLLIIALICLASVKSEDPMCNGCAGDSAGPCKSSYNVCYAKLEANGLCPSGTNTCGG